MLIMTDKLTHFTVGCITRVGRVWSVYVCRSSGSCGAAAVQKVVSLCCVVCLNV